MRTCSRRMCPIQQERLPPSMPPRLHLPRIGGWSRSDGASDDERRKTIPIVPGTRQQTAEKHPPGSAGAANSSTDRGAHNNHWYRGGRRRQRQRKPPNRHIIVPDRGASFDTMPRQTLGGAARKRCKSLEYNSAPEGTRTPNLLIRSQTDSRTGR